MPKKKRAARAKKTVKRAPVKRKAVKKKVTAKAAKPMRKKAVVNAQAPVRRKVGLVVRNLILFAILFVISLVLQALVKPELLKDLFWILALLTGAVGLLFLVILLIFLFMRAFKK